ncbi:MAG: ATP-binding domain-containing protein [Thiomonas sp.]
MALLRPPIDGLHATGLGMQRELQVLRQLAAGLPDDHTVFHNVEWSSLKDGVQWFGEIDAIVLAPNASLVLLEVKAGPVDVGPQGLRKQYGDRDKDIARQTKVQHAALRQRLKDEGLHVWVAQLLVLPDQAVAGGSVNYPRARIVDAHDLPQLCERVRAAVPAAPPDAPTVERVQRFLDGVFALAPDPTARIGWLDQAVTRLSDGLATWAPRITTRAGLFQVEATAGAGKTQLALRLLQDAASSGRRAAYVCFNRPLALQMRALLPESVVVETFHERALAVWRAAHGAPDFGDPQIFARAEAALLGASCTPDRDLLVVDELQDLDAAWVEALRRAVVPGGQTWLLGDLAQALYPRPQWTHPDAVRLTCPDNFRSPRRIVQTLQALGLCTTPVVPRCPIDGDLPNFVTCAADDPGGLRKTADLVAGLLAGGVRPEQIVLLTLRGRDHSRLLQQTELAGQMLRRFSGFDAQGNALYTPGTLLAETVHRFKGQAAPVVVLTEMDFADLDARLERLLFVAFTRAQWQLHCVLSPRAAQALERRLLAS